MMKIRWNSLSIVLFMGLLTVPPAVADSPDKESLSPAMQNLNRGMHLALRDAVARERTQLGPLILFEDGQMKLYRGDEEVAGFPVAAPLQYHQLKVLGHAAFGTVIQLQSTDLEGKDLESWRENTQAGLAAARAELPTWGLPKELQKSQEELIALILNLLGETPGVRPTEARLKVYTGNLLPLMQQGFTHAAQIHLDVIHAQGKKLYALLTPKERETVRGYFFGGRGAREGNLALQYISWLVGENTGKESERIVFSEGITDRKVALNALAKFSAERKLAALVMRDPSGLHRDVLSTATRKILDTFPPVSEAFDSKE